MKKYWGYTSLRPLQAEVMGSVLAGRESLTVMPTGGGKSLCFQLPALLREGMAVVVSPLISLMKDQVDDLRLKGIAAHCLNSGMPVTEQRRVAAEVRGGGVKLLYVAPERLNHPGLVRLLKAVRLSFLVIDEAHCISHWGHDFRVDYRDLGRVKKVFAGIRIHAFTATATRRVQLDIVEQLELEKPELHIGDVDRVNLTYRVAPRTDELAQVNEILANHRGEPGIIYCLRRKDVDALSEKLNRLGIANLPYHAGLSDAFRQQNQERFAREEVDIIVATVAFGMGIDRSNLRFVLHAAMPKNLEHYHQETGRAGRDGLPAACYMLYGGRDYRTWNYFNEQSPNREVLQDKLRAIYNFCARPQCRHKVLAEYFGQGYGRDNCGACDYCLQELDMVAEPGRIGKLIIDCVGEIRAGCRYGFGAGHIVDVLRGKETEKTRRRGHERLTAFGSMGSESAGYIRYMIEQLVGQGFLHREAEHSTLAVTASGRAVADGTAAPVLAQPVAAAKKETTRKKRQARQEREWGDADYQLFKLLRKKRTALARAQRRPAYMIFGDRSLKEMSARKPSTEAEFAEVYGVGEQKLRAYATKFLAVIRKYENPDEK